MTASRLHPGKVPTDLLGLLAGGVCLNIEEIALTLDATRRQVSDAAAKLAGRGWLERHRAGCYQLTPSGMQAAEAGAIIKSGPRGPHGKVAVRRDTLRERAWRSMRVRQTFTVPEIASDASRDGEEASSNIQRYLHQLERAGVVVQIGRERGTRPGSTGFRVWRLVRNSGPRAPIWRSEAGVVRDMNTGEDLPCSPRV